MYGGDAVDGSYLVGAVDYESTSQEFNTVNARYKETFGADMTFSSVFSYETVMAVKEAIELKDSSDWDRVKEGILDIGTFKGLQKDYVIDAYGDSNRKYIVETIIDEKFKRIDQWE